MLPLDVLEPVPAVELFMERYRSQGRVWDVARDRAPTEQVVEYLGRLPLAIELAAARCARFHHAHRQPVLALARELAEADGLGKLRDPLDPTRGVRYVLGRSLEALTPAQRLRFAALGLLAGADWPQPLIEDLFTRLIATEPPMPPAAATGTDTGMDTSGTPRDAAADLEVFVALSLVRVVTGVPAGGMASQTPASVPSRVRIHPLLRDLAREEWRDVPESIRVQGLLYLLRAIDEVLKLSKRDVAELSREAEMIIGAIHDVRTHPTLSLANFESRRDKRFLAPRYSITCGVKRT